MFDYVSILSHITYLITHNPILVKSVLKHKDAKTYQFLIRNLYFLMTMSVKEEPKKEGNQDQGVSEYRIWFDHDSSTLRKANLDSVNEFFKRTMFDNPHLTLNERRAKQDARIIFQKEILKNLTDHVGPQRKSTIGVSNF